MLNIKKIKNEVFESKLVGFFALLLRTISLIESLDNIIKMESIRIRIEGITRKMIKNLLIDLELSL